MPSIGIKSEPEPVSVAPTFSFALLGKEARTSKSHDLNGIDRLSSSKKVGDTEVKSTRRTKAGVKLSALGSTLEGLTKKLEDIKVAVKKGEGYPSPTVSDASPMKSDVCDREREWFVKGDQRAKPNTVVDSALFPHPQQPKTTINTTSTPNTTTFTQFLLPPSPNSPAVTHTTTPLTSPTKSEGEVELTDMLQTLSTSLGTFHTNFRASIDDLLKEITPAARGQRAERALSVDMGRSAAAVNREVEPGRMRNAKRSAGLSVDTFSGRNLPLTGRGGLTG
ncbi:hypothetical protein HK102_001627 [Quaeritorhiza haematococci]|nr:hypothetical protein HK102_001627 [Quaeritorhiza haematococci]